MSKRSARRERMERELHALRAQVAQQQVAAQPQTLAQTRTAIADIVDRAKDPVSRQPRFTATQDVFQSIYNWVHDMDLVRPGSRATTRDWDTWYRRMSLREPFLTGVLNSVIQIDKNRGWSLIGGRNQVARYTKVLHDADNGEGWRYYAGWQAASYYQTRMGFVTEVGKEGTAGPLRALWSVDPTRCQLTGNADKPMKYFPRSGGQQQWLPGEYFRNASMVSTAEEDLGLGFPAVARCLYLAEILVAVYEHDEEMLGARAPRGLLLLNGISQEAWDDAMASREENLDNLERKYYGGVAVLASQGANEVQATLMALSQLPKDFDAKKFTDLAMYGFALAFGYDAREFYPVSSGSLGTATETEVQHQKASSKGDLDFSLAHQEKLQRELPESLQFEYEMRDDAGSQLAAQVDLAKAQVITEMGKWLVDQKSVLTKDQMLLLAAEQGLIPEEWTTKADEVTTTDTDETDLQEQARHSPYVMRAAMLFPEEPILRYRFPSNRVQLLFRRAGDLLPCIHPVVHVVEPNKLPLIAAVQRSIEEVVQEYDGQLSSLVRQAFAGSADVTDFARAHKAMLREMAPRVYDQGLLEGGVSLDEKDAEDEAAVIAWTAGQISYVLDFAKAAVAAGEDPEEQAAVEAREVYWLESMRTLGAQGKASAQRNQMGTWKLGAATEHCKTCISNDGVRHRVKWFTSRGLIPREPGSETLECGGWECLCGVFADSGERLI